MWLFLVLLSLAVPTFACDCNCEPQKSAAEREYEFQAWMHGQFRSRWDGKIVCVHDNVIEVTGRDDEGKLHGKDIEAGLVWAFDEDDLTVPVSRDRNEDGTTKWECILTDREREKHEQSLIEFGKTMEKLRKNQEEASKAYEKDREKRCSMEADKYPDECQDYLTQPEEEEDEHTEPSPEDERPPEQESGNETGPSNHKN